MLSLNCAACDEALLIFRATERQISAIDAWKDSGHKESGSDRCTGLKDLGCRYGFIAQELLLHASDHGVQPDQTDHDDGKQGQERRLG